VTPYASETFLHQLLAKALAAGASDVHLKVGQPPGARVRGELIFFRVDKIRPEDTEAAAALLLGARTEPVQHEEVFAYEAAGLGRFRVSAFRQRGVLSLVMRSVPLQVPTLADLGLPAAAKTLIEQTRGLVVLAGGSGTGKSTTAAALVGHLNENFAKHVITFEDPIEVLHEDRRGSVSQRALGADTLSLAAGLRAALVQDADVLFVADLLTPDASGALEAALDAVELGHLVLVVVAAPDVFRAVGRLFALGRAVPDFVARFAGALQGVLAQRLLPKRDQSGLVLACEVLVTTGVVREALRGMGQSTSLPSGHDMAALREQMEKGQSAYGMQTFEMHVRQLAAQAIV